MKQFILIFTKKNKKTFSNRGFTLLEVLITLSIFSLIFLAVVMVFRVTGGGSLEVRKNAEVLYQQIYLTYRLRNQLEGVLRSLAFKKEENTLYLGFITSYGEVYPGVVSVRYKYKDGVLFYCEKPYPYGDILSCEEEKEYQLGNFENFNIQVFYKGKWFEPEKGFKGLPKKVKIEIENIKIIVPIRVGWVLK